MGIGHDASPMSIEDVVLLAGANTIDEAFMIVTEGADKTKVVVGGGSGGDANDNEVLGIALHSVDNGDQVIIRRSGICYARMGIGDGESPSNWNIGDRVVSAATGADDGYVDNAENASFAVGTLLNVIGTVVASADHSAALPELTANGELIIINITLRQEIKT